MTRPTVRRGAARCAGILSSAILLAALAGVSGAAVYDPAFRFRTMEIPGFSIHYHQGLDNVASRVAEIAGRVDRRMSEAFRWHPREKTQVVLVDGSDFANGFGGALPYNAMYILTTPPAADSTVGEYGDWLETVFLHEYAHILSSDPSRGYAEVMRKIFGKPVPTGDLFSLLAFVASAPPNNFLPRWWHEGMATWAETAFTSHGRGRSAWFDMVYRMAVHEGNFPSIDQVNEDLPYWPDGNLPYIWGLRLQEYIADRYGGESIGELNRSHAGRFPYFVNGPPEGLFDGKGYKALFGEMLAEVQREQAERIAALKRSGFTPVRIVAAEGERLTRPRFSPDGKRIAFNRQDPHRHEAIVVMGADGSGKRDVVRRLVSDRSLAWSPDGGTLYYTQAEYTSDFNFYQDLYARDLADGKERRLTRGMRVSEPDPSPDGAAFAAVLSRRGSQFLSILRKGASGGGREAWLPVDNVTGDFLARISGPRWSPDGTRVAYAVAENDGSHRLELYDVRDRKISRLVESGAPIADPAWSRDGGTVFYVSAETGVYNLFAVRVVDSTPVRLTHLLGGAFHPDVSPRGDEIVFSSYTSRGFRLEAIRIDPAGGDGIPGPALPPPRPAGFPGIPPADRDRERSPAAETASPPPRAYSASGTLFPRFWLPTLSADDEGAVAGAMTAGRDVLGYHTILLNPSVGTGSGRGYFQGKYVYDRLLPTLSATAYSLPVFYSDLRQRGDYYERNSSLILRADLPWIRGESAYSLSLGYHVQRQDGITDVAGTALQGLNIFEGRRDNLFVAGAYSDAVRYPYSISFEEGRAIEGRFRHYSRSLGSDIAAREYLASWDEYLAVPSERLRHHVVAIRLRGGISDGERTAQNSFQLGGPPDTLRDFPLRGYPSRFQTGKYAASGSVEYRFPVRYIFRGPGTAPVFFDRVHAAVFADAGEAWGDGESFSGNRMKIGAGVESRVLLTLGYWARIEPAIGFAYGFDEDGGATAYFTVSMY